MTAPDRAVWRGRPTGPPGDVSLVEIDHTDAHAWRRLTVHHSQRRFVSSVDDSYAPTMGNRPDEAQIGVRWLPIDELLSYRLYPLSMRGMLMKADGGAGQVYLGDIN